jgi:hypothetical protein
MKTIRMLRVLSLFGFLLLFAPFYDSCDGNYPFKKIPEDGVIGKKKLSEKIYDTIVDEESFNGFDIASMSIIAIQEVTFKEFKEEFINSFQKDDWYKNLGTFISFLFDFIILISFSMIILSFSKWYKTFFKLTLINCFLIIITLFYILFLEESFQHFRQIKWGYYAFIITNILIFYYSKPSKIKS